MPDAVFKPADVDELIEALQGRKFSQSETITFAEQVHSWMQQAARELYRLAQEVRDTKVELDYARGQIKYAEETTARCNAENDALNHKMFNLLNEEQEGVEK